jgi:hypothetical protein
MLSSCDLSTRPWEWALYQPLVGTSMLELGNKRKGDLVYKRFFEARGFRHVSVDLNGRDGALPLDLRKPLGLGTFDMVTNLGTTEHVSEGAWGGQVACWRNVLEAMHVGSVLVSITPAPGSYKNHATWYPCPSFFKELAQENGLDVERLYVAPHGADPPNSLVYARLRRVAPEEFQMPAAIHMYKNR